MGYVIGIDGGGTKTQVMLADLNGTIKTNRQYGATNPNTVSKEELLATFKSIFADIKEIFPVEFDHVQIVFAGISGAGSKDSALFLQKLIAPYFSPDTVIQVEADSLNALYSGTFGLPGIVQIAGTGSITYGLNYQNKQDRVGGWGYLLGDEGSGYDVGRRGIMAALQHEDGRGQKTILYDWLCQEFGVSSGRALIDKIYQSKSPKLAISRTSKIVFRAYENRDPVAVAILHDVAEEMWHSMDTLAKRLFLPDEKVDIVLCGGLFSNQNALPKLLGEKLDKTVESFTLLLPEVPPVVGSVFGAYRQVQLLPSEMVIQNLKKNIV